MRKLGNEFLEEAFEYLRPEPEYNLFFIGDLEQFGMEGENVACYTADEWEPGMRFPYFILDYRDNYLVYSDREDYDAETVGRFLAERETRNISGKDVIVRSLSPYLEKKAVRPMYLARLNEVTEELKRQAGDLMGQVRRLTEEDIPAIYELYLQIDEFAYTYRKQPRETCYEDIRFNVSGLGRSYGMFEDGKLVSIAQTSAENRASAMVVGVATCPEKRRKGYAKATVLKLCEDCLEEGMKFLCLFYDNPEAGVIYHSIGFQDMGMYTMMPDKDEEET